MLKAQIFQLKIKRQLNPTRVLPLIKHLRPVLAIVDLSEEKPRAPLDCSSYITRHDHHNLEIKSVYETTDLHFETNLDVFVFVPKSFELTHENRDDVQRDLRARLRLGVPVTGEHGVEAMRLSLATVKTAIDAILAEQAAGAIVSHSQDPLIRRLIETTKDLCAVVSESLKQSAANYNRRFLLINNSAADPATRTMALGDLTKDLRSKYVMMAEIRDVTNISDKAKKLDVLRILDEYLSYIYIQYLATIRADIQLAKGENLQSETLERLMFDLQEKEASYRYHSGLSTGESETELEREQRLVRLSQLKKFFQSRTFLDVTLRKGARHLYETAATIATALAGVIVAAIENWRRPDVVGVAFQGLFLMSFGVFAYVLRDRLKDRAKALLSQKARELVPDTEQQLLAKNRKIGIVKEWLRIFTGDKLPKHIMRLREEVASSNLELILPEDVLHYRRNQDFTDLPDNYSHQGAHALHENIRINFERYLKHMDDPFKELTELDSFGHLKQSRSHRVYHFYICTRMSYGAKDGSSIKKPWSYLHLGASNQPDVKYSFVRVVLDKAGIVRLEELL